MSWHQRRTKKNPKIVKNLYLMKLRHVAVRCEFCDYLYSAQEEINRLNAIAKNHKNCMKPLLQNIAKFKSVALPVPKRARAASAAAPAPLSNAEVDIYASSATKMTNAPDKKWQPYGGYDPKSRR